MSNNKRTPHKNTPSYQPSFITPPPSNRNLYGASSQSSQGTEILSQATEVLSDDEDLQTPPLSQYNEAGVASAESATPSGPRLKKTNAPGFRGNRVYTNAQHRYMFRPNLNDPSQDFPCDVHGNRVPFNDPRRNASRRVANVESDIANLSSATPLSRRNVTARATASAAEEDSDQVAASTLFSPAVPRSRSSALSLTPHVRPPRNRNSQNSPRQHNSTKKNRTGGSRKKRKQRKQRKGTLRKHKTRRS